MARPPVEETSSRKAKETKAFQRLKKRIGKRARELRQQEGLSFRDLHERSGINWRHLVMIEKAQANITLVTLHRLALGLGVEEHELLVPAQSGVRVRSRPASASEPSEGGKPKPSARAAAKKKRKASGD